MNRYIYTILILFVLNINSCIFAQEINNKFTVVLDAGHGGKDPGAVGSKNTNREKDINLSIVLEVGRLLSTECNDVKVVYTRKNDVFLELGQRARIANKAKADLFISVHTNAIPKGSRKPQGVQSYTLTLNTAASNLEIEKRENSVIQLEENGEEKWSYSNPNSSESDIMYEILQDQHMEQSVDFAQIVQSEMVNTAKRNDAGVLQANFAVLRLTYMPSVLLEMGYISTPTEEKYLMSDYGRKQLAKSIFNAIKIYKKQLDK
jgi:N-acetylmuramoyl-L-alanine amidase